MTQELPPGQDADEIQGLAQVVAESLAKGEDPQKLVQQLVDSGWDADEANAFVSSMQHHLSQAQQSGSGSEARGWMVWLGAILGINFLSWVFNWGFWIY